MTEPLDLDEARANRPRPFRARSIAELPEEKPRRDWLIESILLRRSVTLLAGDGGMGKSLLCLQLQVAAAIGGATFLGIQLPDEPIMSFGLYCEDDDDEVHRRLFDVCRLYGISFRALGDRVRWLSSVGEESNELVRFKRPRYGTPDSAVPEITMLFRQIEDEVRLWHHQLIIIDTATDTYGGNENVRSQVRAFITKLRRLAMIANGGVLLTSHPSKSAIVDGSGFSGSTAWNGSVRNRLYLTKPRPAPGEDGEDQPSDERVLKIMKSNYGPFGQRIKCRYKDGIYELVEQPAVGRSIFDKIDVSAKLMGAADYLVRNGTYISADRQSRTALIALAKRMPSTREFSTSTLDDAYLHLLETNAIVRVQASRDRKWRDCVRPAHLHYPVEREAPKGLFEGGSAT